MKNKTDLPSYVVYRFQNGINIAKDSYICSLPSKYREKQFFYRISNYTMFLLLAFYGADNKII